MEADRRINREFEISRVLSRTFETIGANLGPSLALALPLSGIPFALMHWWFAQNGYGSDNAAFAAAAETSGFWAPLAIVWTVNLATDAVLQGTLIHATIRSLTGKPPRFADALERGFASLLPVLAISLIVAIGISLATLLLIIPGILLAICWSAAVPAYVEERTGITGSLGRSIDLARGEWGNIFLMMLIVGVGCWAASWVAGIFDGVLAIGGSMVLPALVHGLVSAMNRIVWITVVAAAYLELRSVKEGNVPSELETVFN